MDRTLVIALSAPIPRGHRVEVMEQFDEAGAASVVAIVDLETGVRYERAPVPDERSSWIGTVLTCTISSKEGGSTGAVRTTLVVDPVRPAASESDAALRGADAAADAAKAEADRWGGGHRPPWQEPTRIW